MDKPISDLLLGILVAETRQPCLADLASELGAEEILLFLKDPDRGFPVPAPGFPRFPTESPPWREFVAALMAAEGDILRASLPSTEGGEPKPVAGVGHRRGVALLAIGAEVRAEKLAGTLPWLPWMEKVSATGPERREREPVPGQTSGKEAELPAARMHALFMEAPAPIAILRGPEHVFEFANPLYNRLVGNRELIGRSIRKAFPDLEGQGVYEILDEVYRAGETYHGHEFPARMDRGNGVPEEGYFNFIYQPMRDSAGRVEGIMVFAFEVTSQVLSRKKSEESTRLISGQKRVLERLAEGASLPDILEVLTRIAEEQSEGVRASILLLDADAKHLRHGAAPSLPEAYNRAIDGIAIGPEVGSCGTAAYRGMPVIVPDIGTDPRWRDFRDLALGHGLRACWSLPIQASSGKVLGTFALYYGEPRRPTSLELQNMEVLAHTAAIAIERKRTEDERQKLAALVENSGDLIAMAGLDGRLLYVNPAGRRLVGIGGTEDVTSIPLSAYRSEESPRFFEKVIMAAVMERGQWQGETRFRHLGTGRDIDVHQNIFLVTDPANRRPICLATVVRDITERKQSEEALRRTQEQLAQSQKMESIGKLAGGIAHDFNNLLTAINGYAALSMSMVEPKDPVHGNLLEIRNAGERAATLTRQLLAYSRKQVLAPRILDINAIVSEMHNMLKRVIGEDLEMVLDLDPDLGVVKADPGQIEQVVLNLVVNARDATPGGGRIVLRTRGADRSGRPVSAAGSLSGPFVCLSVEDSGTGMEPEVQARIFEPFFTTKEFGKGSGMGLAMVHGIVSQSGGFIQVDSAPGEGSTFRVYLPKTLPEEVAPIPSEAPAHEELVGRETVLVVEDEDSVRRYTRRILEMHGYTVLEGRDGKDGLKTSEGHSGPIDVLLTDVVMPRMNGRELAERLLRARPGVKVLFMSGYTDDAIMREGLLDQDTDFIQKPFTSPRLVKALRRILDRARSADRVDVTGEVPV